MLYWSEQKKVMKLLCVFILIVLLSCVLVSCGTDNKSNAESSDAVADSENSVTTEAVPEYVHDPDIVYGSFAVYEYTEENIAKFKPNKSYDVSTSEYSFSLIIVATENVTDFKINRLMWNEELLVEDEEVIENVGEVKAGEAMLITTDSVEIVGYIGISYTVDGETERYYPATSGMDGSALLVEIGNELMAE